MALDKAIDSAQLDGNLTAVADAIRAKGGTSDAMVFPDGFVEAVGAIDGGFDIDAFMDGSFAGDITINAVNIRQFGWFSGLKHMGNYTISIPNVKTAYGYLFQDSVLGNLYAPSISTAHAYAFNKTTIDTLDLPGLVSADRNAFRECNAKSINIPAFQKANGGYVFSNVRNVTELALPALATGADGMCEFMIALKKVDIGPNCSTLTSNLFSNCVALKTLILRCSTAVTLSNVNTFVATPFALGGTGGTVYVPQALIVVYQAATNWVTLYDAGTVTFAAIEGSEYE